MHSSKEQIKNILKLENPTKQTEKKQSLTNEQCHFSVQCNKTYNLVKKQLVKLCRKPSRASASSSKYKLKKLSNNKFKSRCTIYSLYRKKPYQNDRFQQPNCLRLESVQALRCFYVLCTVIYMKNTSLRLLHQSHKIINLLYVMIANKILIMVLAFQKTENVVHCQLSQKISQKSHLNPSQGI